MAWTAEFTPDTDKNKVGQVTATWNKGQADEFVFSKRYDLGVDTNRFAAAAQSARTASESKTTRVSALITSLEAALN